MTRGIRRGIRTVCERGVDARATGTRKPGWGGVPGGHADGAALPPLFGGCVPTRRRPLPGLTGSGVTTRNRSEKTMEAPLHQGEVAGTRWEPALYAKFA